jgi:hypothetical protein
MTFEKFKYYRHAEKRDVVLNIVQCVEVAGGYSLRYTEHELDSSGIPHGPRTNEYGRAMVHITHVSQDDLDLWKEY